MAMRLDRVGDPYDTATFGPLTAVDELIPTADGGYKLIFERQTEPGDGTPRIDEDFLATIGPNGLQNGPLLKFDEDLRFGHSVVRSDGSLLVSFGMRTHIILGTVGPTGEIESGYSAELTQILEPPFTTSDGGVAFGTSGVIAVARIGEGTSGKHRAVDILTSDLTVQTTLILDRDLTTDDAGSTTITALSDGRFLVTWTELIGNRSNVVARVITSAGLAVGPNFVVGQVDDGSALVGEYAVTALPDGAFALSYQGPYMSDSSPMNGAEPTVQNLYGQTWVPNGAGGFTASGSFDQDNRFGIDALKALITLSDGRMVQIVQYSNEALSGDVRLTDLLVRAHVYDARGAYTGETFDLFQFKEDYGVGWQLLDDVRAVALEDDRFALIVDSQSASNGAHSTVQILSLSSLPLALVRGTTGGNDTLQGNSRTDLAELLKGGEGNDHLLGFAGNDKLSGGNGDDRLDGGTGADRMGGGRGNDTYIVDAFDDFVVEDQRSGYDTVTTSMDYCLFDNVEALVLTGTAALNGRGNALDNVLTGNNGANLLDGGKGADVMRGWGGDDTFMVDNAKDKIVERADRGMDTVITTVSYRLTNDQSIEILKIDPYFNYLGQTISLTGNDGATTIVGSYFADVLNGKGGADILTGAGGPDTFVFDSTLGNGNVDRITDFASRFDRIKLDDAIVKGLPKGRLADALYKDLSKAVVDADDRVLYDPTTGELAYDVDGRGGAKAVTFAILGEIGSADHPAVINSDLFIV